MTIHIRNFGYTLILSLMFCVFLWLHLYGLSSQEFLGDEASPMLLISRMWDAFRVQDFRFLAYPFLFYHDPFRAIFSGTLLSLFGPDKLIVRIPGIVFDSSIFIILAVIFHREKFSKTLNVFLLLMYMTTSMLFVGRLAGGDAQARLLFLLTGYLTYRCFHTSSIKYGLATITAFGFSLLTMLNALVFAAAILYVIVYRRLYRRRTIQLALIGFCSFFALYFTLWTVLPYAAFVSGFQAHYIDRGFWYYLSRTQEVQADYGKSLRALISYSSVPYTVTLLASGLFSLTKKHVRVFAALTLPAWLALFLLSRPSFHIVMYAPLFFLQASFIFQEYWSRKTIYRMGIVAISVVVICANIWRMSAGFLFEDPKAFEEFQVGHLHVPRNGAPLDEAVKRLYEP